MKNLLENARVLSAVVGNIESCECSFQDKGLESLSCSLNKNEKDEIIVDIVGSFDIDKILLNIQEEIRKETCAQIDDWVKEMEKDFGSIDPKTFSKYKSTKSDDVTSFD